MSSGACDWPSLTQPHVHGVQPFSQKSHTPTVPKEFQIGLYDPTWLSTPRGAHFGRDLGAQSKASKVGQSQRVCNMDCRQVRANTLARTGFAV